MTLHEVDTDGQVDGVVDSTARFEQRRWSRRMRGWRRWLIAATLAVAAGFLIWVVFFSTWLGVQDVQVDGLQRVTSAEVLAAADVSDGTPLARVDLDEVQARVESLPSVASAAVHRSWPHSITVTVTERRPVAVVHDRGSWWLMDPTGVLFHPSKSPEPSRPIVEVEASAPPQTRQQVASMLGLMPGGLLTQTNRVTAASQDSIALHLTSGAEVRWGDASASAQKAAVLEALLPEKATYYDVSVPSQPATKG